MKKAIFEDFDGYKRIVDDIAFSRKHGTDYTVYRDAVDQQISLLHPNRMTLRVSDIMDETPSTKTLRVVSRNGYLPPFLAGQYIALFLEVGGVRTSRPYSISSPPNQTGYYDITVRRVAEGRVSNYLLDEVSRGDLLESSGPSGHFYFNPLFHDRTMVCLAGGSGVTPFMSMIRQVVACDLNRTLYIFYGNKTLDEAIFHDELNNLSRRFENIVYVPVIEDPPDGYDGATGLMTGDLINKTIGDIAEKTFYLCGPQGMYDFCVPELARLGVPGRKIRKEVYGPPADIWKDPGWPDGVTPGDQFRVRVRGADVVQARADAPLLTALEDGGIRVPSLCRSGECSMCRVKILSGKVFQPAGVPIRKSDRQFGYVHACVSYPLEDLEIVI
ncbi:MAG: 2Fe-2S iron-sulfur cluster binding domain-containing protein [Deltaproteobacteria bacterium]|nr:2Fe-2S iron-sulfur cluster binding domain-containing protein [Deltaproteobacteria bacterium]